jgi:hypothetical protein
VNVPLPQPIEVASCRTVRDLVELLGSLLVETEEADAVTVDDWARFGADCHDRLPETHAEWIDTVPFAAVRAEAERQLRDGEPQAAAVIRNKYMRTATTAGSTSRRRPSPSSRRCVTRTPSSRAPASSASRRASRWRRTTRSCSSSRTRSSRSSRPDSHATTRSSRSPR